MEGLMLRVDSGDELLGRQLMPVRIKIICRREYYECLPFYRHHAENVPQLYRHGLCIPQGRKRSFTYGLDYGLLLKEVGDE